MKKNNRFSFQEDESDATEDEQPEQKAASYAASTSLNLGPRIDWQLQPGELEEGDPPLDTGKFRKASFDALLWPRVDDVPTVPYYISNSTCVL